jgi:integrase
MSIKQIAPGRWKIVVTVKYRGKVYKREATFSGAQSKAVFEQAKLKIALKAELEAKEKSSAVKLQSFKGLIDLYKEAHEWPSRMGCYAAKIEKDCGKFPVADLQAPMLKYFALLDMEKCTKEGWKHKLLAAGTKNRLLSITRMVCRNAVKHGLLAFDPVALVRPWREEPRNRILSADELKNIRTAIRETCAWLEPAFEFSIQIPIRLGDLVSLKMDNLDRFNRCIRLRAHKTGASQVAPIPPELDFYFKELPQQGEYLFSRAADHLTPLGDVKHFWQLALDKAEVSGVRWHDLRHHACTYLHQLGGASHEIQTIGGWKSRAMVERYHALQESDAASGMRGLMEKRIQENKPKIKELQNVG